VLRVRDFLDRNPRKSSRVAIVGFLAGQKSGAISLIVQSPATRNRWCALRLPEPSPNTIFIPNQAKRRGISIRAFALAKGGPATRAGGFSARTGAHDCSRFGRDGCGLQKRLRRLVVGELMWSREHRRSAYANGNLPRDLPAIPLETGGFRSGGVGAEGSVIHQKQGSLRSARRWDEDVVWFL